MKLLVDIGNTRLKWAGAAPGPAQERRPWSGAVEWGRDTRSCIRLGALKAIEGLAGHRPLLVLEGLALRYGSP